jgi:hypothetical protein
MSRPWRSTLTAFFIATAAALCVVLAVAFDLFIR